jgi:hypothetical protein
MIPSKIAKQKLTYNQLRQVIQRIILTEQSVNAETLSSEDVNLFIETYLIKNTN